MQEQIIDGRYRICGRIGQGGMSTVYLAEELQTKEQVALKWVRRAQMRRFGISEQDVQREAELMRGIDHPALPRIREQFVSEDGCIIVMDRVKGQTLADILHRDGTLSVRQTCDLGIRLCQVLSCLHAGLCACRAARRGALRSAHRYLCAGQDALASGVWQRNE